MTKSQRIKLMAELWPNACAAQHWSKDDREKRLDVLSAAVDRPITSANDLNQTTDYDRVKAHLHALAHPADLDTQVAIANMPRTRLLHAIHKLDSLFGVPRSADFQSAVSQASSLPPSGHAPLSPYGTAILKDRFGTTTLDNLTDPQLIQLRNTLAARASARRAKERSASPDRSNPEPVMDADPF
jgi:hypothetical protein